MDFGFLNLMMGSLFYKQGCLGCLLGWLAGWLVGWVMSVALCTVLWCSTIQFASVRAHVFSRPLHVHYFFVSTGGGREREQKRESFTIHKNYVFPVSSIFGFHFGDRVGRLWVV